MREDEITRRSLISKAVLTPKEKGGARERRLADLCALFNGLGDAEFVAETDGDTDDQDRAPLMPGWSLRGGPGEEERQSAAAILRRLYQADEEIQSLSREILERYEEATLIYRLSESMGAVLGEPDLSRLVLRDAAEVLGARAGGVWMGERTAVALMAAFPDESSVAGVEWSEAAGRVLRNNRPWLREGGAGVDSMVAVPLPSRHGDPIGGLVLRGRDGDRSFRSGDVKLLTALATLTSAFIRNHRLAEQSRRAEARRREDEIARQVHRGLLPRHEPDFPGLDISGACRAAENIGGDYYGYLALPDGSLAVAMGDISGHGVGPAIYMAAMKGALQAEARRELSPDVLLERTNQALVADFATDVFATAFIARFHSGGGRVEFANGGHNPPFLVRADGRVEQLAAGGPALGVMSDAHYGRQTLRLDPGDLLLIYTDGVVEARDDSRRFYGLDRLKEVVAKHRDHDSRDVRERVLEDLERHCAGRPLQDDVTLVVVRYIAAADCAGEDE